MIGPKIIIPQGTRENILIQLHVSHQKADRSTMHARALMFGPDMKVEIEHKDRATANHAKEVQLDEGSG